MQRISSRLFALSTPRGAGQKRRLLRAPLGVVVLAAGLALPYLVVLGLRAESHGGASRLAHYRIDILDVPGAYSTNASTVSTSGAVGVNIISDAARRRGWLWNRGVWQELPAQDSGASTVLVRLCDGGRAAGYVVDHAYNAAAVVWEGSRVRQLDGLPAGQSGTARDMNKSGVVVGYRSLGYSSPPSRAVLWQGGSVRDLPLLPGGRESGACAINGHGEIAGWADARDPGGKLQQHAVVWIDGKIHRLPEPPGTKYSVARAINEQGMVVGWVTNRQDLGKQWCAGNACVWERGRCTEIRISGTTGSKAFAVNNRGEVVGTAFIEEAGERLAFLWTRELGGVILGHWWHHLVRFELSTANDINDRGQIVGAAFADSPWPGVYKPSYGYLLTPAP
jgi:uncharacterized membrane protein